MRFPLYALLCSILISNISIEALHTPQSKNDVAWETRRQQWLTTVYLDELEQNIDEHIKAAQKQFELPLAPTKTCSGVHVSPGKCAISEELVWAVKSSANFSKIASLALWAYATKNTDCLNIPDSPYGLWSTQSSPLCQAIVDQQDTFSSFLVHCGASPNHSTFRSVWTSNCRSGYALPVAVANHNNTIALLLLQHGARVTLNDTSNVDDMSALHKVFDTFYKHITQMHDMLTLLLRYCLPPENTSPFEQWAHNHELYERNPILHYALRRGDVRALKIMLEAGINPNISQKKTGLYPLDVACQTTCPHKHGEKGRKRLIKRMCKILFKYGATQCCKPQPLADEALDELIEKYEIALDLKGEACTICLPLCARSASSLPPYTHCKKHCKEN